MKPLLLALLLVGVMFSGCAEAPDADGDGLDRDIEKQGWTVFSSLLTEAKMYKVTSDPNNFDTDGDGLSDFDEYFMVPPLDPRNPDTDGDGWTDCQEAGLYEICPDPKNPGVILPVLDAKYQGWPAVADADAGLSRFKYYHVGFSAPTGVTPKLQGDGILDRLEAEGITYKLANGETVTRFTDPNAVDSDDDGLEDGEEIYRLGSDPLNRNTDGDICPDGQDVFPGIRDIYALEVRSFTLKKDQDSAGGADLQWKLNLLDDGFKTFPPSSIRVEKGKSVDLSGYAEIPREPRWCTDTNGYDGWVRIGISFYDVDGGELVTLDSWSSLVGRAPGDDYLFWWHAVENRFTYSTARPLHDQLELQAKVPASGEIVLEGADARVVLVPKVILG